MIFTNDKILIGDKAYDSKLLEEKVKNMHLGVLLRDRNKRVDEMRTHFIHSFKKLKFHFNFLQEITKIIISIINYH